MNKNDTEVVTVAALVSNRPQQTTEHDRVKYLRQLGKAIRNTRKPVKEKYKDDSIAGVKEWR